VDALYLVNAAGDCNGFVTCFFFFIYFFFFFFFFFSFFTPSAVFAAGRYHPGTNGNLTGNLTHQGSNPKYGDPYLDGPVQSLDDQLKANYNIAHFQPAGDASVHSWRAI